MAWKFVLYGFLVAVALPMNHPLEAFHPWVASETHCVLREAAVEMLVVDP